MLHEVHQSELHEETKSFELMVEQVVDARLVLAELAGRASHNKAANIWIEHFEPTFWSALVSEARTRLILEAILANYFDRHLKEMKKKLNPFFQLFNRCRKTTPLPAQQK